MKQSNRRFIRRLLISTLIIATIVTASIVIYKKYLVKSSPNIFKTEVAQKRTITQVISVSGVLTIKESFEVGSLQPGIVKQVLVKQNDHVKKGQLICVIDTGKEDTELREAQFLLDKAAEESGYQKNYYNRQEQLYKSGQLSKNGFEEIAKNYKKALDDVRAARAVRDKRKMEYESTFIKSPTDGIVLSADATNGMRTTDTINVKLFDIAHDPKKMEAALEIDESDIGNVAVGMPTKFVTNSFPDRVIKGKIDQVSFTPKTGETVTFYKARVNIDNQDLSLRPGMIVNAKIKTQKAKNALSLSGLAFQMDEASVKTAAHKMGFSCTPGNREALKKIRAQNQNAVIKYVWVVHDKHVMQKPVSIGITDNSYWQIIDGLSESDNVLLDIEENAALDDLYKKAAGGAF